MAGKEKLRRVLKNRHSLTAAAFLLMMALGSFAGIFGGALEASSSAGFARPTAGQKADAERPRRERGGEAGLSAAALGLATDGAKTVTAAEEFSAAAAKAEAAITAGLESNTNLIDIFGGYQRLIGRTAVEDSESNYSVMRLSGTDSVTFVSQPDPSVAASNAAAMVRLKNLLDEKGIALLYAQAPSKIGPEDEKLLPYGVSDGSNAAADALLTELEAGGVDTLDLRQTLKEAGGRWQDWFYKTDHHWTPQAAFVAFQDIAEKLGDYYQTLPAGTSVKRQRIAIDERYLDGENYTVTTLKNYFLGSQGKRVGTRYAEPEDFDLITPDFATLLHYTYYSENRYGSAEETVLFPERVEEKDYFGGNPYTYYSGGDYPSARITNYYNPDGPKVLVLRDSFACAITPYLAYACSEVATVDLRYYTGYLESYIDWVQPDAVIVLYSPSSLSNTNSFRFFPTAAETKGDSLRFEEKALPAAVAAAEISTDNEEN